VRPSRSSLPRPSRPSRPSRSDLERRPAEPLDLDIVVPVYNEAAVLEQSIRRLHAHLTEASEFSFQITIADNASTDETLEIARRLGRELPGVSVLHLAEKGRGRALRAAWGRSEASVVAYTDVDLSSDLAALGDLVTPLLEGRGDLAIGSRLTPGARVTRSVKREVISRTYNLLLRAFLEVGFADAQCGFKAGRREVVQALLPLVENDRWFFDTELLYQAERNMFSIREVPVAWVEDQDSRVAIAATVREDLDGIARLRRSRRHAPAVAGQRSPGRAQSLAGHHVPHLGRPSS
jgi:glycosyltransferase involved in cell wall biosynthesis